MKKQTFTDWAIAFSTAWLGPKLGTALAVLPLAGIIVSTAIALPPEIDKGQVGALDAPVIATATETRDAKPSTMAAANTNADLQIANVNSPKRADDAAPSMRAFNAMVKQVTKSTEPWQVVIYAVAGGLWLLTMLAKGYVQVRKPGNTWIFKASQLGDKASALFGFAAGMLVVPLALCWAIMLQSPGGIVLLPWLLPATVSYTFICASIHWAGYRAAELPNAILYVLQLPASACSEKDGAELLAQVHKKVDGTPWISPPEYLAQSDDGQSAIILPIRYPVAKWSNEEAQALLTQLQKVEQCWVDQGVLMHAKVLSPAFTGKVAPGLKAIPKPTPQAVKGPLTAAVSHSPNTAQGLPLSN